MHRAKKMTTTEVQTAVTAAGERRGDCQVPEMLFLSPGSGYKAAAVFWQFLNGIYALHIFLDVCYSPINRYLRILTFSRPASGVCW